MKLKLVIFVMALAAMGPGRSDAPPDSTGLNVQSAPEPTPPPTAPVVELPMRAADDAAPGDFLWQSRPLVVFADTPNDPAFVEQMRMLRGQPGALVERDVVVIADSDPGMGSDWRDMLHPRGFSLVLIDKDGQIKLRKPFPWSVREISRAIDKFPLRRQEIGRADLGE
ncbi:DUF4174 domain-containing protein [Paracoccus sp. (in: a-proteobacteria)]|uniref:DUF4174 domain-containing protein n=1 Tax=Paracoccus sp. TaxID=267 RepID=UPI003A864C3A